MLCPWLAQMVDGHEKRILLKITAEIPSPAAPVFGNPAIQR